MSDLRGEHVLPLSLTVKLGSIVVHAQEANSEDGTGYDLAALAFLVDDPDVIAWLSTIDPVFLPEKRSRS